MKTDMLTPDKGTPDKPSVNTLADKTNDDLEHVSKLLIELWKDYKSSHLPNLVYSEKHEPVDVVPTLIGGFPVHESVPTVQAAREAVTRSKRSVTFARNGSITSTIVLSESAKNPNLQGCELRLPEFPNYDITLACRRYFALIERLVSECEAQHVA